MTETVVRFLWVAALVFLGLSAVIMKWFYNRLRNEHYEVWRDLGEPSFFLNASILMQQRVSRFLWRSEYKSLDDRTLDRLARVSKLLALVALVIIVAGFVATIDLLS